MQVKAFVATALALGSSLVGASPLPEERIAKRSYPNGIFVDQKFPYAVSQADLDAVKLVCPDGVTNAAKKNILFVPGTGENGDMAFAQGYLPAYKAQGYTGCYLNIPNYSLNDAQFNAEYVVSKIDELYSKAGNKQIYVVAHSQGGLITQWALNFWPSRRDKVASFLGLAPDFHGTAEGPLLTGIQNFTIGGAPPSVWQQSVNGTEPSNFLKALAKHGDTPLVPTTSVYGSLDEIVEPVYEGTNLNNIVYQDSFSHINLTDACPGSIIDHFATLLSPPAFWIGLDALQNGVGKVDRAKALAKKQGSDFCATVPNAGFLALPSQVATIFNAVFSVGSSNYLASRVPREPALQPYAANQ